ncbi:MAG: LamG domain-containing protein [Gammaproteobacteria bacterium]|nr:LamG domain-containing protein [Gammaproteobacteria bacterium]
MKQGIHYSVLMLLAVGFIVGIRSAVASSYDNAVLANHPVLFLTMAAPCSGGEGDVSGHGRTGTYFPVGSRPTATTLPNGDFAADFDGSTQYLEVADADALSVPTTGVLTIEAWMRADALPFTVLEGSGYVHWLGKGTSSQQEYALRMYSDSNGERANRISGYAFNLNGGLGSGSYFEDPIKVGQWIHVTMVINMTNTSPTYPTGYVKIYKNGVLRDTTALNQYDVVPGNGTEPLRIGTRDRHSFFLGAIGKVAIYKSELTQPQIATHYVAMCGVGCL